MPVYRGSRKHVLDWVVQPGFPDQLNELLEPTGIRVSSSDSWMPRSYEDVQEARLEKFGPTHLSGAIDWRVFRSWWLAYPDGANTPNWDIAATARVGAQPAIVLVEAKANVPELKIDGKVRPRSDSKKSNENHRSIGEAIDDACAHLRLVVPGLSISRDHHYQLANRIAFAWKLASLGLPVALVYLGFWGDTGISGVGEPFRSDDHWRTEFWQYASTSVPTGTDEKPLDCGASHMFFLVRSRKILEVSPPAQATGGE